MKILNTKEIKQVAMDLSMTEWEAKKVTDIFAKIYINEQEGKGGWKINSNLNNVDEYITEWDNHWHREYSWVEFYEYEKENCFFDYDNADEIFESLNNFKEYVRMYDFAYELQDGMIIIVC